MIYLSDIENDLDKAMGCLSYYDSRDNDIAGAMRHLLNALLKAVQLLETKGYE